MDPLPTRSDSNVYRYLPETTRIPQQTLILPISHMCSGLRVPVLAFVWVQCFRTMDVHRYQLYNGEERKILVVPHVSLWYSMMRPSPK